MFAQTTAESEDDDGVDGQNVAHVLLDHEVLDGKPAHAENMLVSKKLTWKLHESVHLNCQKTIGHYIRTNHTITSRSRMHRETVAAFAGDMDLISNTMVKLRSVAMVVHVAYVAILF